MSERKVMLGDKNCIIKVITPRDFECVYEGGGGDNNVHPFPK